METDWVSILGWPVMLGFMAWWFHRRKHPATPLVKSVFWLFRARTSSQQRIIIADCLCMVTDLRVWYYKVMPSPINIEQEAQKMTETLHYVPPAPHDPENQELTSVLTGMIPAIEKTLGILLHDVNMGIFPSEGRKLLLNTEDTLHGFSRSAKLKEYGLTAFQKHYAEELRTCEPPAIKK